MSEDSSARLVCDPSVSPIITLLSDFGTRDPYVGSMKGVILSICRTARIVDLTHSIDRFSVSHGAYVLASVVSYFPVGAIHVCVVDPGVGTKRKALIVKTRRSYLIGPDNGVLMLAADREVIEKVIEITNSKYMLGEISSTFHGRDIFGPVAAHLANGIPMMEFGEETDSYNRVSFPRSTVSSGMLSGEVIHLDDFGNIITNISLADTRKLGIPLGTTVRVVIERSLYKMKFDRTYGDVAEGQPVALIGSVGLLEISVNSGNAASSFKARKGSRVTIYLNQP
jgi:hypothetical protein